MLLYRDQLLYGFRISSPRGKAGTRVAELIETKEHGISPAKYRCTSDLWLAPQIRQAPVAVIVFRN